MTRRRAPSGVIQSVPPWSSGRAERSGRDDRFLGLSVRAPGAGLPSRRELHRHVLTGRTGRAVARPALRHGWLSISVATWAVGLVVLAGALGIVRAELRRMVLRSGSRTRAQRQRTN